VLEKYWGDDPPPSRTYLNIKEKMVLLDLMAGPVEWLDPKIEDSLRRRRLITRDELGPGRVRFGLSERGLRKAERVENEVAKQDRERLMDTG
jgi:hypothetical protein